MDIVPERIPFDVTHGPPISLERAQAVINAVVAEAKKRDWKMNIDVVVVRDGKTLVELTCARENKLPVALIQNRAGAWVEPIAAAATAAIEAFRDAWQMMSAFRWSIRPLPLRMRPDLRSDVPISSQARQD